VAETLRRFDLAQLQRLHDLAADVAFMTSYRLKNGTVVRAKIFFCETQTVFGHPRLWFVCPTCGRRCRVLFGSWRIACGRCHRVRYLTQTDSPSGRAVRGMFRVVRRFNPAATVNQIPPRPYGMHRSTYKRLVQKHAAYSRRWFARRR
jgi:hypothetical protein